MPKEHLVGSTAKSITEDGVSTIKKAISELPDQTRRVLECVLLQDMKYQEAADELGISINNLKTQLKRGVLKFKTEFKDQKDLLYLFFLCK